MTNDEIAEMLNRIADTHYSHAPIGTAIPFITYITEFSNNFGADDKVYQKVKSVTITAYMGSLDLHIDTEIQQALDNMNIYWTSSTDYDSDQKLYTTTYEMEVI